MRITNAIIMNTYLSNLNGNLNRMSKYLEQESTGKAINDISDDPVKTTLSLSARNKLSSTQRYQENVSSAEGELTEVESAVSELNAIIQDAYERAVQASSDTVSDEDLSAISEEIKQLMEEVLNISNTTYGDNYLFAGYNSTGNSAGGLPFTVDANGDLVYNGINMSNEAAVDDIAATAQAAAKAISNADTANNTAQAASTSDYFEVTDAVSQVSDAVNDIIDTAGTAVDAVRDLVNSAELSGTTMSDLLEGAASLTETAVSEAEKALTVADNSVAAAEAAAEAAGEAYDTWQAAIGTDSETEAYTTYTTAATAAETAAAAVQDASDDLYDKAEALQTAVNDIQNIIAGSDELGSAYGAVSGAVSLGASALAAGNYTEVAAQTGNAADAADAAVLAGQKLAAAAYDTGDTTLYAALTTAISTAQTAAQAVSDAAALVTDGTTAATAQAKAEEAQTAVADLQALLDGYSELSISSVALDEQSDDVLSVQVGTNRTIEVTISGTELLGRGEANLYVILEGLYNALSSGADADELNGYITKLQDKQSAALALEAELGAKLKALNMISARYEKNVTNYTQMKSDAEDADLAEAITNYTTAQTVYNAALAAGAEIIQTSLLDFLD